MLFIEYLKFFFFFGVLFLLPGLSLLYLLLGNKKQLSALEYFLFGMGLSLVMVDGGMIAIDKMGILLNTSNLLNTAIFLIVLPLVISTFSFFSIFSFFKKKKKKNGQPKIANYLKIKKNILPTLLIGLFLSFFITTIFLKDDIVPNNTDLGHHMYWVGAILNKEQIIPYATSDVIVGEHLPFVALSQISKISVLSSFPVLFLMFINIASFLAVFALALRIFKKQTVALLVFFLVGVLYSLADPMGKFVAGGVIGNVLGNLFSPLILLSLYLAVVKKDPVILTIAIFLFAGIFYTHHLSTFVLIFVIFTIFIFYLLFHKNNFKKKILFLGKTFFHPLPLLAIGLFIFSVLFVYTPSYIESNAVQTVIQTPEKDTRQGINWASLISSIGEWKTILGIAGLLLLIKMLIKNKKYRNLGFLSITGWTIILLLLSFYPQLFRIDLPSRRIVNYLVIPFSLLAGFFSFSAFHYLKSRLKKRIFAFLISGVLLALILNGLTDSLVYLRKENQFNPTVQLYHASLYLKEKTGEGDLILKDHVNIVADTWISYFLQRGYKHVLSRTFDYKYQDPLNKRETCTRDMVVAPDSESGLKCYQETGVNYLILKKDIDNFFFDLSDNFSKIYENHEIVIYRRNPKPFFSQS